MQICIILKAVLQPEIGFYVPFNSYFGNFASWMCKCEGVGWGVKRRLHNV